VVSLIRRDFSGHLTMPAAEFERRRADALAQNAGRFGTGRNSPGLYAIGVDRALVGRRVGDLDVGRPAALRARLNQATDWAHVDPASGYLPALVTGKLTGGGRARTTDIVIAVNGVVRAAAPTFAFPGLPGQSFAEMIPEASLHPGANRIAVYAASGPAGARVLTPLTETGG
jgi:hypothetical protein